MTRTHNQCRAGNDNRRGCAADAAHASAACRWPFGILCGRRCWRLCAPRWAPRAGDRVGSNATGGPGRLPMTIAVRMATKVGEVMSGVSPPSGRRTTRRAVRLMEHRHVKRLPVVADGRLVGIVSRANLMRAAAPLTTTGRFWHRNRRSEVAWSRVASSLQSVVRAFDPLTVYFGEMGVAAAAAARSRRVPLQAQLARSSVTSSSFSARTGTPSSVITSTMRRMRRSTRSIPAALPRLRHCRRSAASWARGGTPRRRP